MKYEGIERRVRNGSSKLIWWMMASACGVVFLGFMGWMTALQSDVNAMNDLNLTREGQIATLTTQVGQLITQQGRMEEKIDQLLERKGRRDGQ